MAMFHSYVKLPESMMFFVPFFMATECDNFPTEGPSHESSVDGWLCPDEQQKPAACVGTQRGQQAL